MISSVRPRTGRPVDKLNPEQREAVLHGDGVIAGPLLIIAGAGSGKTGTLAHRVAHCLVKGAEQGEQKLPAEGGAGERTRARQSFRPRVDIFDSDAGLVLVADIPGAGPEDLDITLERGQLTIRADVKEHAPEGMSELYREYEIGDWERSLRSRAISTWRRSKRICRTGC